MPQTSRPRPKALAKAGLIAGLLCLAFSAFILGTQLEYTGDYWIALIVGILPLVLGLVLAGRYVAKYLNARAALVGCGLAALLAAAQIGLRLKHFGDIGSAHERSLAVAALCERGTAIPEAPALRPSGPHSIRVATPNGNSLDSGTRERWIEADKNAGYSSEWQQSELPELVACLSNEWTVAERRAYTTSGGSQSGELIARQHHYEIDVYEARTRKLVFHTRVDGGLPPPLPESFTTGRSTPQVLGPKASAQTVMSALEAVVQGR